MGVAFVRYGTAFLPYMYKYNSKQGGLIFRRGLNMYTVISGRVSKKKVLDSKLDPP